MRKLYLLSTLLLSLVFQANAQCDKIAKGFSLPGGMNDSKVASGLKQALEIGTTNTVTQTGATNGYFGNQAIKILLPEKLRSLEKGLRLAGQGAQVDDFELSMNWATDHRRVYDERNGCEPEVQDVERSSAVPAVWPHFSV